MKISDDTFASVLFICRKLFIYINIYQKLAVWEILTIYI